MSKIETYNNAKAVHRKISSAAQYTLGRDSPRNDKAHFNCWFIGIANESWTPMKFQVECSHGYYGSSSAYSDTSEELGRYFAKAINIHKATLLDCAEKLAADDAERARKAAEDEAKSVLNETVILQASTQTD